MSSHPFDLKFMKLMTSNTNTIALKLKIKKHKNYHLFRRTICSRKRILTKVKDNIKIVLFMISKLIKMIQLGSKNYNFMIRILMISLSKIKRGLKMPKIYLFSRLI